MEKQKLQGAIENCVAIVRNHIEDFEGGFPSAYSKDNKYFKIDNNEWTTGFYVGILWLCYEYTQDELFKNVALEKVRDFERRLDENLALDTHDIGFLYSLSAVAGYKITGEDYYKEIGLRAADLLMKRYSPKGGFIQAWGKIGAPDNYRLIIDCLLNLPLLYWASEVTGDNKYYDVAYTHAKTAVKCVIREDNSTYHTYFFDMETGKPSYGETCQGYKNDSAWARGQAWGVYGTILSYNVTGDKAFEEDFFKVTQYFIDHLPEDYVPYWDFTFSEGEEEPRDSSAAAIVACGLHEMAKYTEDKDKKEMLENYMDKMLTSLIDRYSAKATDDTNGLLYHGTYSKKSPYNTCTPEGVDECVIWGDYFYLEALMRLNSNWRLYW